MRKECRELGDLFKNILSQVDDFQKKLLDRGADFSFAKKDLSKIQKEIQEVWDKSIPTEIRNEFLDQMRHLINRGYPEAMGISIKEFMDLCLPFHKKLRKIYEKHKKCEIPFFLTIRDDLLSLNKKILLNTKDPNSVSWATRGDVWNTIKTLPTEERDIKNKPPIYLVAGIDRTKRFNFWKNPPGGFTYFSLAEELSKRKGNPLTISEGLDLSLCSNDRNKFDGVYLGSFGDENGRLLKIKRGEKKELRVIKMSTLTPLEYLYFCRERVS